MIETLDFRLPEHKCGLYLEHNVHRDYHTSIEDAIKDLDEHNYWISPEERQKCLDTGEIWSLQWYPDNPISFFRVVGSTLEAAMRAACGG